MNLKKCWPSAAAYHAYWRARGYHNAMLIGRIFLCAVVAAGIGGAGTVISGWHPRPAITQTVKLDAP